MTGIPGYTRIQKKKKKGDYSIVKALLQLPTDLAVGDIISTTEHSHDQDENKVKAAKLKGVMEEHAIATRGGIHEHGSVKIRSNLSKNDQLLIGFLDQQ